MKIKYASTLAFRLIFFQQVGHENRIWFVPQGKTHVSSSPLTILYSGQVSCINNWIVKYKYCPMFNIKLFSRKIHF